MLRRSLKNDEYVLTMLVPNKGCANYYVRSKLHETTANLNKTSAAFQHRVSIMEFYKLLAEFNTSFIHQGQGPVYSTDC